ncbi:related to TAF13 - TFIID subunit involved in RNA polymerase II transcription initiation [Pseudozyma flocculosa]|uniref:Transcription initiation factor TFIID subunit 13 n=1 Tax=Pseudozyma flocculosa TaxID=84751 RepID=A0A5C3F9A8_9BASI|nr:related to TAF13 - TFIID subunit involved in RNA polymerase II transcription initiation [Pseudozyma flocculosa]
MAPTPGRGSQRPDRSRQGSSAHPAPHPYQPGGGRRGGAAGGAAGFSALGAGTTGGPSRNTPFVHPALAASTLQQNDAANSSSSAATTAPTATARGRKPFNHRNLFAKDLRNLMYAYGDVANPDSESVALLEEMTVDFITDLCARARPSPYALGLGTSNISTSTASFGSAFDTGSLGLVGAEGDPSTAGSAAWTHEVGDSAQTAAAGAGAGAAATSAAAAAGAVSTVAAPATLPPRAPHRQRVKLEDFRHALRKDVEAKKLGRLEQLLYADRIVTEARKVGGVEEVAEKAGALSTMDPQQGGSGGGAAIGGAASDGGNRAN